MKFRIAGFFLAASLFLMAARIFTGTHFFPSQFSAGNSKALSQGPATAVSQVALAENYKAFASAIMRSYEAERLTAADPAALARKTKEDLLALRVPETFTDLHLRLVVSVGLIEQGLEIRTSDVTVGEGKLSEILQTEPWLVAE